MSADKIRDALKNVEQVALAYTFKTSQADSPEEFVEEYANNLAAFKEIKKSHEKAPLI